MPFYYDWNFMVGLVSTIAWLWVSEHYSSWFWLRVAILSVGNFYWQRLLESAFHGCTYIARFNTLPMPLYYDLRFVVSLVFALYTASMWLFRYNLYSCVLMTQSFHNACWTRLLALSYRLWRQQPVVLNNAAPANGNAAQLQRGRLRNLPDTRGMLVDVFQCLPRVGLDACQLASRQFCDAVEDARATLPLYPMVVSLRPSMLLVEYAASIVDVGSVTGHFFTGLRRCDTPYFRNAAISLRTRNATYARTSTDMLSAFVRWLNLRERNVRFTAYARGEITRPLTIGCDASVPLPELWPENGFLAGEENSPQNGPLDGRGSATMQLTTERETNFYEFSMPC